MDYSDDDISWLTQEPSLDSQMDNSDVHKFIEEDIPLELPEGVISLEQNCARSHVLYDGVVVEDISSYEYIDKM